MQGVVQDSTRNATNYSLYCMLSLVSPLFFSFIPAFSHERILVMSGFGYNESCLGCMALFVRELLAPSKCSYTAGMAKKIFSDVPLDGGGGSLVPMTRDCTNGRTRVRGTHAAD